LELGLCVRNQRIGSCRHTGRKAYQGLVGQHYFVRVFLTKQLVESRSRGHDGNRVRSNGQPCFPELMFSLCHEGGYPDRVRCSLDSFCAYSMVRRIFGHRSNVLPEAFTLDPAVQICDVELSPHIQKRPNSFESRGAPSLDQPSPESCSLPPYIRRSSPEGTAQRTTVEVRRCRFRLTAPRLFLDDCDAWTSNALLTRLSSYTKCLKRRT